MRIFHFVINRLMLLVPVLLGLITLVFFISNVIPGDPAILAAGEQATPETVERIRQEFGFDRPIVEQYFVYLGRVLRGDLGRSVITRRPVLEDISVRLPASIELALFAMGLATIFGILAGVISAMFRDRLIDHVARIFAISTVSIPRFWLALILQLVVAGGLAILPIAGRIDPKIPFTPISGFYLVDTLLAWNIPAFKSALAHILLPAIALSVSTIGIAQRLTRAGMLDVLNKDYITNARATSGIPEVKVNYKYALKNAMLPTVSQLGVSFGSLLGGSIFVESIFDWPGLGTYLARAAVQQDFQPIIGGTIVVGLIFVIVNLAVDILYSLLNPRISLSTDKQSRRG